MREFAVCGAAIVKDEARVIADGVPDQPGVSHRIFAAIAEHEHRRGHDRPNVGTDGKATIGFTVPKADLENTLDAARAALPSNSSHDEDVSKVSIVGTGMRTQTGVAERLFAALAAENINV